MLSDRDWRYWILLFNAFVNGWFVSSFGPLIPHFSQMTGLDETDYAYLFMVRCVANVAGSFMVKYLLKRIDTQQLTIIYLLVVCLCSFLSTFSLSAINLTINIFFASASLVGTTVITYGATFQIFPKDFDYRLQFFGFIFGVGAMCGPLLVAIFKIHTLKVLAVTSLITIVGFMKYPLQNLHEGGSDGDAELNRVKLSNKSVGFICLIFFFFATSELGMGSWISTYSIKAGVSDVESSAIYSLLFWLSSCTCRLAWIYVPGTIEQRLGLSLKATIVTAIVTVIFQSFGWLQLVCIFAPIATGILTAGVYGFGIALPVDKGFPNCSQANANFILANALGEGMLIMPLGYSISLFGFKVLMIEMCIVAFATYWAYLEAIKSMQKDLEETKNQLLQ